MVKLKVLDILANKEKTKYWLLNEINSFRAKKGKAQMSYTNFLNLVEQKNSSIRYDDLYELCTVLDCKINDILVIQEE